MSDIRKHAAMLEASRRQLLGDEDPPATADPREAQGEFDREPVAPSNRLSWGAWIAALFSRLECKECARLGHSCASCDALKEI